ncbi:MAG: DUF1538 domain-containing protein [Bacilli bacterium]|nr:DUF1538 domain-containing protein [Bacilli bacterium]
MLSKFKDSVKSILPITVIVLIISVFFGNGSLAGFVPSFLIGAILLMIGMCLFDIGADISMIEIGSKIGTHLTNKRNIPFILIMSFIIGFIITVAEPDLSVLASQVPSISSDVLICTVGIGVGIFLLIATFRMLFQFSYSYILIFLCVISFIIGFFVPEEFVPLAFDSGGVTTGPLSVPFIIALGAGLSAVRNDSKKKDDTFGMISFCSVGPVIIVLILGLIYKPTSSYNQIVVSGINSSLMDVVRLYINSFPIYLKEVFMALSPIAILFLIYNFLFLKLDKKDFFRIVKGLIYTYIGLSIFLTGVNVGFMPMGYMVGNVLSNFKYLLVPLGMILGYFIVSSEPAVTVLTEQIEEITNGNIKKKIMDISLSIGVSVAVGLSIVRVLTGISIWYFLIPGYAFALIMTFFVPPLFTALAFDSGGVASGTMTATFLLPFVIGVTESLGGNILTDAFGLIAMVATIPLITVQLVGLIYKMKIKAVYADPVYNEEIIDY